MENYSAFSEKLTDGLSENFKELTFHSYIVNIGVNISVFLIQGLSEQIKKENTWRKISEEVALSYQSQIESIEDKWNIYIIYVFTDIAHKELKSLIENDKFSSRKIVVDNMSDDISDEIAHKIIAKHITNTDLIKTIDDADAHVEEIYVPNDLNIWSKIPTNKLVSGNLELQKNIIKQLKACCNEN